MTMKNFESPKSQKFAFAFAWFFVFAFAFSARADAQTRRKTTQTAGKKSAAKQKSTGNEKNSLSTAAVKVTQIVVIGLKNLLKRQGENAKPLLVNFWATWCDPCREEFPELVKINHDYAGKIDFIVVSIDDLAEIKRDVPKFLNEMKAEMPAYLLKTEDEQAAIAAISKNYQGGLPFTILFNPKGESVYFRQGKIKAEILRQQIENLTK